MSNQNEYINELENEVSLLKSENEKLKETIKFNRLIVIVMALNMVLPPLIRLICN